MSIIDTSVTFLDAPRPVDGGTGSGSTNSAQLRLTPSGFEGDNGQSLAGSGLPGAREISNIVFTQTGDLANEAGLSSLVWVWGQFLDHDIDRTPNSGVTAPIPVPADDPVFDPDGTGTETIGFRRALPVSGTGTGSGTDNPRQYSNSVTAFIDGSQLYGSTQEVLDRVRVADSAKLRLDEDELMLFQNGNPTNPVAGDVRAGENIALSAMHAVFTREHNRIVDELAAADPTLSTEALFEGARARVEAILQAITYNEFLPLIIGPDAIEAYQGFDPDIDPQISIEFSAAAFRLGHSMLSPTIARRAEDGSVIPEGDIALRDAFFNNAALTATGIDPIMRGMATTKAQALDSYMVEDVRSFLSLGGGLQGGFDLAALNIQRGRDMGLPRYNAMRVAFGLEAKTSFAEITSDPVAAARLEAAYGTVDAVEAWVGGVAEDALPGGVVGELFAAILVDQFSRLRDGDQYWSESRGFSEAELEALWSTTLSDVIVRNSGVAVMQRDAFLAYDREGGTGGDDTLTGSAARDLLIGNEGDDLLDGDDGDDDLHGGLGNDTLLGGDGDDLLDGGEGQDSLDGGLGDDSLLGGADSDTLNGGSGADTLLGGTGNDRLSGGANDDELYGGDGADTLNGDNGDDTLIGESGNDWLSGFNGSDLLDGGAGRDFLLGGAGDDLLIGGDDIDTLRGDDGNDTLIGGAGIDTLVGGEGADRFVFAALTDSGSAPTERDTIVDFEAGIDVIDLTGIDADPLTPENDALVFVGAGPFTAPGQVRVAIVGDNTIVHVTVDADLATSMAVRLRGQLTLSADDFDL